MSIDMNTRPISVKLNILECLDGSCQWTQGNTCVLVGVLGPCAPKKSSDSFPEFAYIDMKIVGTKVESMELDATFHASTAVLLKQQLLSLFKPIILDSQFPRCQISITVQIIEDDGSVMSCCINAITMALIDAGIPINNFISSCTVAIDRRRSTFMLDPTEEQLENSKSILTTAWNNSGDRVLCFFKTVRHLETTEFEQQKEFIEALGITKRATAKLMSFKRQTLEKKVNRASASSQASRVQVK